MVDIGFGRFRISKGEGMIAALKASQLSQPRHGSLIGSTIDLRKFDIADRALQASSRWPQRWQKTKARLRHVIVQYVFPIKRSVFGKEREIVRNHQQGC
jgi:hypothetical protein